MSIGAPRRMDRSEGRIGKAAELPRFGPRRREAAGRSAPNANVTALNKKQGRTACAPVFQTPYKIIEILPITPKVSSTETP